MKLCPYVFSRMETSNYEKRADFLKGLFLPCVPSWFTRDYFSLPREEKLQDIWNGRAARLIRNKMYEGDFSFCNRSACQVPLLSPEEMEEGSALFNETPISKKNLEAIKRKDPVMPEGPGSLSLTSDFSCNLKCGICRDKIIPNAPTKAALEEKDFLLENKDHIEVLKMSNGGEIFYSSLQRSILKGLNQHEWPRLKRVHIVSNGTLFSEGTYRDLMPGSAFIKDVNISIDAGTKEVYEKMRGPFWEQLLVNLGFLSDLRKKGALDFFAFHAIVIKDNFRDIPNIVALAERFGADRVLLQPYNDGPDQGHKNYADQAVQQSTHPDHQEFLELLERYKDHSLVRTYFNKKTPRPRLGPDKQSVSTGKKKRLAIITTKQNYVWTSMQEVLPALEKCWLDACDEGRIINVDQEALRDHISFLMKCDAMIVIAYNETVARFINAIRKELQIEVPLALHLYGNATVGLWPEERFNTLPLLQEGDAFIGTCEGDLKCMELTLKNADTFNVPYPYFEFEHTESLPAGENHFAYIGRLSDQKNVDLLIEAYALTLSIESHSSNLVLYGTEDFLGSPNMGEKSTDCQERLKELVQRKGLQERVLFKGFVERTEIYKAIGRSHIFVSASTHSDENFGMAAMRSLYCGSRAVLSDWGGHKNYFEHFAPNAWSSKVFFKNDRPVIDPLDFAQKMLEARRATAQAMRPHYFLTESVSEMLKEVLKKMRFTGAPLVPTALAKRLYEQQRQYEKEGQIQRVFSGYNDELARAYLRTYL